MIKINRAEAPRILQNTPRSESSYNNHNVTSVLLTMQFTKCAYCEKSIKEGAQVDHYIPIDEFVIGTNSDGSKRYNWTKANRWQNLLYSCVKCNGAKKRKNPFKGHTRVIIDPSNSYIDPEKYLDFRVNDINNINVIVSIIPKNKSTIGKNTINNLKLDIRRDHIGELNILAIEFENLFLTLLLKIKQGLDINHIDIQNKIEKIQRKMLSNRPYAGFARSFFSQRLQEFEHTEKSIIESKLRKNINLDITIPEGVVT